MPVFLAQIIGAEVALFSNFILHHNWTYKSKKVKKSLYVLFIQFNMTSWPAIIGSSIMVSVGIGFLHFSNLLALSISSIIVLIWNYIWSKYVVWGNVGVADISNLIEDNTTKS